MVDNEVVARIAKKIRTTRLEKKLTIQQLANRTRVSKGLLSKIENMRTIPSLPVFVTLVQSLDVSLKDFFKDLLISGDKSYVVVRRQHYMGQNINGHIGVRHHHILMQSVPGSTMEASYVVIEKSNSGRVSSGTGYVLVFLITGACQFIIDGESITLNEGDCISFDGSTDHSISSDVSTTMLQISFTTSG